MSRFLRVFPRVALVLSILAVVLTTGPLVLVAVVSRGGAHSVLVPGQSALSKAIVLHPLSFVLFWWTFAVVAVAGSLGLIRRKMWGLRTWVVLLALVLLWSIVVIASEAMNLAAVGLQPSPGYLPSFPVAAAVAAIPLGCVVGGVALFLLLRLLSLRHKLGQGSAEA
jgi:hypothetical protein